MAKKSMVLIFLLFSLTFLFSEVNSFYLKTGPSQSTWDKSIFPTTSDAHKLATSNVDKAIYKGNNFQEPPPFPMDSSKQEAMTSKFGYSILSPNYGIHFGNVHCSFCSFPFSIWVNPFQYWPRPHFMKENSLSKPISKSLTGHRFLIPEIYEERERQELPREKNVIERQFQIFPSSMLNGKETSSMIPFQNMGNPVQEIRDYPPENIGFSNPTSTEVNPIRYRQIMDRILFEENAKNQPQDDQVEKKYFSGSKPFDEYIKPFKKPAVMKHGLGNYKGFDEEQNRWIH